MKVAVVGDEHWVAAFMLAGAIGFPVKDRDELRRVFKNLINDKNFGAIILSEEDALSLEKERRRIREDEKRVIPLIIIASSFKGSRGLRRKELTDLISTAVGAEVKL